MHLSNQIFWQYVADNYSAYIQDKSVYEFGSHNVNDNGDLRKVTVGCEYHIGIDWREGPSVDVVSLAHEFSPGVKADVILSASMLEHDPYFEESLTNMVSLLKSGGLIVISWGAALNFPHCHDHSPDGRFWPLPAGKVINILSGLGIDIVEFLYEGIRYPEHGGGNGEVALIGFKGQAPDGVEKFRSIDQLLEEDSVI